MNKSEAKLPLFLDNGLGDPFHFVLEIIFLFSSFFQRKDRFGIDHFYALFVGSIILNYVFALTIESLRKGINSR